MIEACKVINDTEKVSRRLLVLLLIIQEYPFKTYKRKYSFHMRYNQAVELMSMRNCRGLRIVPKEGVSTEAEYASSALRITGFKGIYTYTLGYTLNKRDLVQS